MIKLITILRNKDKLSGLMDKIIEYSLYGLIFFLPASSALVETFAGIAFISFIIKKCIKPDFRVFVSLPHLFLCLFVLFNILSMFNSGPYFKKSFITLFFKWLEYIGIFLFAQTAFTSRKCLRNALIIFLLSALIIGIDGLSQQFLGMEFLRHKSMQKVIIGVFAGTGPFHHYNDFGIYLVAVLSLTIAPLISNKVPKIYIFFLVVLLLILCTCLLLTFSRGSWISFVCVLFFMLYYSGKAKELVPIFILFALLMIVLPLARERLMLTFKLYGDADRLTIWKGVCHMIKDNPFLGKGVGTFMDYFINYMPKRIAVVQYAHNCYLQIWAETGIFSLLSFLLFVGSVLYKGVKVFEKSLNFTLLAYCGAAFGFTVHIFFDTDLYSLQLAALFWLLLGLIMSETNIELADSKQHS